MHCGNADTNNGYARMFDATLSVVPVVIAATAPVAVTAVGFGTVENFAVCWKAATGIRVQARGNSVNELQFDRVIRVPRWLYGG